MSKHRYHYTDNINALESEKAGRETAERRYGPLSHRDGAAPPRDQSRVQPAGDAAAAGVPEKGYPRDAPKDWVRGFGKGGIESAESKPGYLKGYRGK